MTVKELKSAFTYRQVNTCKRYIHLVRYMVNSRKIKSNENGKICCEKMTEMVGERVPVRYDYVCDAFEENINSLCKNCKKLMVKCVGMFEGVSDNCDYKEE